MFIVLRKSWISIFWNISSLLQLELADINANVAFSFVIYQKVHFMIRYAFSLLLVK